MKLTVCIPAHNEEIGIRALLSDVIGQEQRGFRLDQVIVASDGSVDQTAEAARSVADNRVLVIDDAVRRGKGARLNQMMSMATGDVVMLLDADIRLPNSAFIAAILERSEPSQDGLIGIATQPESVGGWIDRSLTVGAAVAQGVAASRRASGRSCYLDYRGTCLVLSADLARRLELPMGLVNDDAYIYFAARTLGYTPRFLPDVKVRYMLPRTLKDHSGQARRHQHAKKELGAYFPAAALAEEYDIPRSVLAKEVGRLCLRAPLSVGLYASVRVATTLARRRAINHQWDPASSTKNGIR